MSKPRTTSRAARAAAANGPAAGGTADAGRTPSTEPLRLFDDSDFVGAPVHPARKNEGGRRGVRASSEQAAIEATRLEAPQRRTLQSIETGMPSLARLAGAPPGPEEDSPTGTGLMTQESSSNGGRMGVSDVYRHQTEKGQGGRALLRQSIAVKGGGEVSALPSDGDPSPGIGQEPMTEAILGPRLVTIIGAGRLLGVGRTTVYQLIGDGELQVVHVHRSARIPVESIDAYVARLRETAISGRSARRRSK
jgi:excisionase family DNA binding protein